MKLNLALLPFTHLPLLLLLLLLLLLHLHLLLNLLPLLLLFLYLHLLPLRNRNHLFSLPVARLLPLNIPFLLPPLVSLPIASSLFPLVPNTKILRIRFWNTRLLAIHLRPNTASSNPPLSQLLPLPLTLPTPAAIPLLLPLQPPIPFPNPLQLLFLNNNPTNNP
jgi:hypothetical protein